MSPAASSYNRGEPWKPYIGQTVGRTFGERIEEHNFGGGSQEDRAHIEIYVGRLKGATTTPSSDAWRNEINWAEKLLIHCMLRHTTRSTCWR
jgi:hypothetical protein